MGLKDEAAGNKEWVGEVDLIIPEEMVDLKADILRV